METNETEMKKPIEETQSVDSTPEHPTTEHTSGTHKKAAHHPQGKRHRRRRRRKESKTLKIVNAVLLLSVGIALAACAFTGYRYLTFSTQPYDAQIAALTAETDNVRTEMEALQAELQREDEQMRSDLHQAGEAGAAAAEALQAAQTDRDALAQEHDALTQRVDFVSNIHENTIALRQEYAGKIRQLEDMIVAGQSDVKICYWSFDDGPGLMTSSVLDFCQENGIYVTFFTSREANETGQGDVDEPMLLRRETMLGNSVQNHTNSHQYSRIAGNLYTMGVDSFREQVRLQDEWILENTGFKPDIFRFPGGSAWAFNLIPKEQMVAALDELGYHYIDWACDVMDNLHSNPDPATVYTRATWQIRQIDPPIAGILSHDWNVNTYYGFMRAVPYLKEQGYIFLPLFSQSWAIDNTVIRFS